MANFRNLTDRQLAVFEQIATGNDAGRVAVTLHELQQKGLVIGHRIPHGFIAIYRYEVPINIRMEWCEWCAANYQEASDGNF